jgi:ribonucleoside-diphosphate reductase alpha chain
MPHEILTQRLTAMSKPSRTRLPLRRTRATTVEGTVAGNKVSVTTGEYPDGTLGEIFIDMHKTGAAFHALMNCFAMLVSLCLQHGVPLSLLVKRFRGVTFEPAGLVTGHEGITEVTSVVDFVFQALARDYAGQAE